MYPPYGQVDKTRELTEKAKTKASSVEVQARAVAGVARGAAKASERQQAALGKAKTSAEGVASAGEKARLAFRWGGRNEAEFDVSSKTNKAGPGRGRLDWVMREGCLVTARFLSNDAAATGR